MARELGTVLWQRTRAELEGARVELETLALRLRRDRAGTLRDDGFLAGPLEEDARRVGWWLGVLGAAHDADCLQGRHEEHGLRWTLGAVERALGAPLEPGEEELPLLGRGVPSWEVCLLAGWCALRAAGSERTIRWEAEPGRRSTALVFPHAKAGVDVGTRIHALALARPGQVSLSEARGGLVVRWS